MVEGFFKDGREIMRNPYKKTVDQLVLERKLRIKHPPKTDMEQTTWRFGR